MAPTVLPLQCCGAYSAAPVRWSVPGRKNPQMAEVVLFHHVQGLTPGVVAFADELRAAGHTVHTPDLFEGRTFGSIDEGMAHIKTVGFDELRARGVRLADVYPSELVYGGFSFGESIAQELAQTRAGARGALLFYSCIP